MLCRYCDLKLSVGIVAVAKGKPFCDIHCASAYLRETSSIYIQKQLDYHKKLKELISLKVYEIKDIIPPMLKEDADTRLKHLNLLILFNQGCLNRQTKAQLTLIYDRLIEYTQIYFTKEYDKDDPEEITIFCLGQSLSPVELQNKRDIIDLFGR